MALQLADRSFKFPHGIVEDLLMNVGDFIFPADFVVLDMEEEAKASIILGRPFLATAGAIIDVQKGELTLRLHDERMVFNILKAMSYPPESLGECMRLYAVETVVQETFEEALEGLTEGDSMLNVKVVDVSSAEMPIPSTLEEKQKEKEAPKLELKALPPTLKYAYLKSDGSYPVIINSALSQEQKEELIKVLQKHQDAIGWTLADLKGISSSICMHKILLEDDSKPSIQVQRRLNPVMKEVVQREVIKLWQAGVIYPISDGPWVSLVHVVPKKGGITFVPNEKNELIPTRTEFNIKIKDKKGVKNKVADHLSRIPCEEGSTHKSSVNEFFPDEQSMLVHKAPWFADIANFRATGEFPSMINKHQKRKLINDAKYFIWDEPYLFKKCSDGLLRRCISEEEGREVLLNCHGSCYVGYFGGERIAAKVLQCGFFRPTIFKDARVLVKNCNECQRAGNLPKKNEMPQQFILELELFDWVDAIATPTNDNKVVLNFL
ncbi:uncharacterized protein [Arachis hypogaea]|uniref:uncharacterized protein n=1 Tax=Arachis hypogaea TaxID=3818 RepID=UPI003B2279F8